MRKDNPLFINITTRGFPRGSYLEKKIEQAKAAIEGESDDIRWEKSNPYLRVENIHQEERLQNPPNKGSNVIPPKRFYMCTNCGQQFEVYNNDKIKPKEIYPPEPFTSEKPNTRVILDIGIDTIPSEFTAEVLLRLIGNYCNEFDRFIIGEVKNGVIKFRFDDRKF